MFSRRRFLELGGLTAGIATAHPLIARASAPFRTEPTCRLPSRT